MALRLRLAHFYLNAIAEMARREGLLVLLCGPAWSGAPRPRNEPTALGFEAGFGWFQEAPETRDFGDLAHIA
jgi:hypothetical protein